MHATVVSDSFDWFENIFNNIAAWVKVTAG